MILIDKPYVSDFMKKTLAEQNIPVIQTPEAEQFDLGGGVSVIPQDTALRELKRGVNGLLYTNSENSINWIVKHLGFMTLPKQIARFKDKFAFRNLLKQIYPHFAFSEVETRELDAIDVGSIKMPFIIKPSVGFFSMGVHKVSTTQDWSLVLQAIHHEMKAVQALYPSEVLDTTRFIIEECIEGEEYAVDTYFNHEGKPVILNILHHLFASGEDVRDRVYITSRSVMTRYREELLALLTRIGRLASLKNFPVHAEVRIDGSGNMIPIEVNPMRFAGWCTTDVAFHAYGINPYEYYFRQKEPDWNQLLRAKGDETYSIIVLDKPGDVPAESIEAFDYGQVLSRFEKPLELRKIDYTEYPVFGFLFAETRMENMAELENILSSDLKEFIRMRPS